MSDSAEKQVTENHQLYTMPGSENEDGTIKKPEATFRNNLYHRRLAMCSIICGISCIGIQALKYSFKAEHTGSQATAEKVKKYSIISIVVWVFCFVSFLILMAFFSYLAILGIIAK